MELKQNICVYIEIAGGALSPLSIELLGKARQLADAKGRARDFEYYNTIERLAPKVIAEKRHIYKGVSTNVDFYSGFVYNMLGIPRDLYTPLFVISRMVGWLAHNIEHKLYDNRIVRPAAKYVGDLMDYIPRKDR